MIRWLWYSLCGIGWIRRYVATPPDCRMAGYMTPAMWEWKRACHEWNRGYLGPRRECDSPYDDRWPKNEHDERALRVVRWQKNNLRARGYTFVRG